ncbi:MAG: phosphopantothenoylcysteine decarboxylase [Phycisphaerae bacterium]|nr:phosphopantothenoylcysteine decarboxylase [Phycisphaerae bacterium]
MDSITDSNEHGTILIGICGGIAAYKMAEVVSTLVKRGDRVTVAMTRGARRFVGPVTFESLSGRPVFRNPWKHAESHESPHIALARQASLMLIAPCTMDMLSSLSTGRADDPVSLLAASIDRSCCPVLLAPSMNETMLNQPSTRRNLSVLEDDGFQILAPESGWQACRTEGAGRLPEPAQLVQAIDSALSR